MSNPQSIFGAGESAEESIEEGGEGGGDTTNVESVVTAALKRSYLESFGEDLGDAANTQAQKRSFKLYQPDLIDESNPTGDLSTNPMKLNFGPYYQLRDLEAEHKSGIVLQKSDANQSLVLAIGGDSSFTVPTPTTARPELTAVYRAGNNYVPLYDDEVRFFALSDEPGASITRGVPASVALVEKPEDGDYRLHFKLLLKFKLLSGDEDILDSPRTYSDTILRNDFDVIAQRGYSPGAGPSAIHIGKIRAELRRKSDDELVPPPSIGDEDYGYITVSDLLNVGHYVKLWHEEVNLQYDFGDGPVYVEPEYLYDVWVADQTLTPSTAITVVQQLGPLSVPSGVPRSLQWATLPKQVYDLEVAIQELTGETVAAVQQQENTQNSRLDAAEAAIGNLGNEAGLDGNRPQPTEEFPHVRLCQRFAYTDDALFGRRSDETVNPFRTKNLYSPGVFDTNKSDPTLSGVFSLPIPKIWKDGPDGSALTEIQRLFEPSRLLSQGALGLMWTAIVPEVQTRMAQLTTFPPYRVLRPVFTNAANQRIRSEPLHYENTTSFTALTDRAGLLNMAVFRPDPTNPGQETMNIIYNGAWAAAFVLNRARQLLPDGFILKKKLQDDPPVYETVPTTTDPTQNLVHHNYLPLDLWSKRSGPEHFIQYVAEDDPPKAYAGAYFALEHMHSYITDDAERDPTAIDVRGGLEKAGTRLDKLEAELNPVYDVLRGLHQRVSSIEHWREAR